MCAKSTACESFYFQPLCAVKHEEGKANPKFTPATAPSVPHRCPDTDSQFLVGGPIWMDPMHDAEWVQQILTAVKNRSTPLPTQSKAVGYIQAPLVNLTPPVLFVLADC